MSRSFKSLLIAAVCLAAGSVGAGLAADAGVTESDVLAGGQREVAFGQFTCASGSALFDFEGTSGFATDRIELQRSGVDDSEDCVGIANAVAARALEFGCVTSEVRTDFGYVSMHLVCHGRRNRVVHAVGSLATELLTFPLSAPGVAPDSRYQK